MRGLFALLFVYLNIYHVDNFQFHVCTYGSVRVKMNEDSRDSLSLHVRYVSITRTDKAPRIGSSSRLSDRRPDEPERA